MAEESDIFLEGAKTLTADYTPTLPNLISDLKMELLFDEAKLSALNAGNHTNVFLVGMPSEIGARAMDGRAGAERGPESFREMIQLCALPSNPACTDI